MSAVMWFLHGELLAVKWRNFKFHLIVRERSSGPVVETGQGTVGAFDVKLGNPWIFDIENDPKELWNAPVANSWRLRAWKTPHHGRSLRTSCSSRREGKHFRKETNLDAKIFEIDTFC